MSPHTTTVVSRPPYHGMPVFPQDIRGLTAFVLGANGISGQAMLQVLAENPERWSTVLAVSRKKPSRSFGPTVQTLSLDLLQEPEAIAKEIGKVGKKMHVIDISWCEMFQITDPLLQRLCLLLRLCPASSRVRKSPLVERR